MPVEKLDVPINPSLPPTVISDITTVGSTWIGKYTFTPPANTVSHSFQQASFPPPLGHTSSPGASNVGITAGAKPGEVPPFTYTIDYTGAWLYPGYFEPANVEIAFNIIKTGGNWPSPTLVTVTLTYTIENTP
jgi:hypothetical protein